MTDTARTCVNAICAAMAGAEVSSPFGPDHDVWKVGGKIFAIMGAADTGVSIKCRDIEAASMLIESGAAIKAPYLHRSWALIPFGIMPDEELAQRIALSWRIIAGSLPKKVQAMLGL